MSESLQETATEETEAATTEPTAETAKSPTTEAAQPATDGEKGGEGKVEEKPEPVDYSKIELPEGVAANEQFDQFKAWAEANNVSLDAANELMGLYAEAAKSSVAASEQAWLDEVEGWKSELAKDKEFGGRHIEATKTNVSKALDKFGEPGLQEILESTKIGDHPALVRTLARVGQLLAEDQPPRGGARDADPLRSIYPTMFKEEA